MRLEPEGISEKFARIERAVTALEHRGSKVKLADDWKSMWKWISAQCVGALVAIHGTFGAVAFFQKIGMILPSDTGGLYTKYGHILSAVTIALCFGALFGLAIQQDTLPDWLPWKIKPDNTPPNEANKP